MFLINNNMCLYPHYLLFYISTCHKTLWNFPFCKVTKALTPPTERLPCIFLLFYLTDASVLAGSYMPMVFDGELLTQG